MDTPPPTDELILSMRELEASAANDRAERLLEKPLPVNTDYEAVIARHTPQEIALALSRLAEAVYSMEMPSCPEPKKSHAGEKVVDLWDYAKERASRTGDENVRAGTRRYTWLDQMNRESAAAYKVNAITRFEQITPDWQ